MSVRQRRVSAELREWRKKAGLTCKQVADALDVSVAKVSRMETGERGLFADDVSALLGLYRVPQQRRVELLELVRTCHEPNWWQIAGTADASPPPAMWSEVIDLESRSAAITNFETMFVPGLAQTPEYAAEIMRGSTWDTPTEATVQALVRTRISRSSVLSARPAPTISFILDEAVLRRPVGGAALMAEQLQHLLAVGRRENVCLQVLPFAAGVTPGLLGPSVLYDLREGGSVVLVEARGASGFLSEAVPVRRARIALKKISSAALSPHDSAQFVSEVAKELRTSIKE